MVGCESVYKDVGVMIQSTVAVMVTEWALTMPPVEGVRDLAMADGEAALDQGYKGVLNATTFLRDLKTDEEREEWDAIFSPIPQE
jgi:hypothetical protein